MTNTTDAALPSTKVSPTTKSTKHPGESNDITVIPKPAKGNPERKKLGGFLVAGSQNALMVCQMPPRTRRTKIVIRKRGLCFILSFGRKRSLLRSFKRD